jgi:hypothetical protein
VRQCIIVLAADFATSHVCVPMYLMCVMVHRHTEGIEDKLGDQEDRIYTHHLAVDAF